MLSGERVGSGCVELTRRQPHSPPSLALMGKDRVIRFGERGVNSLAFSGLMHLMMGLLSFKSIKNHDQTCCFCRCQRMIFKSPFQMVAVMGANSSFSRFLRGNGRTAAKHVKAEDVSAHQ